MTKNTNITPPHPHELEQASNSYLMAIVAIIAGLPLPVINSIASVIYYLTHRKSSYFVRWHCIQSILSQAVLIPFNSFAFAWTVYLIFKHKITDDHDLYYHIDTENSLFNGPILYFGMYISFVLLLNILEFFTVIYTASRVRKGENVRLFFIANLADALTSKQNRDPFVL